MAEEKDMKEVKEDSAKADAARADAEKRMDEKFDMMLKCMDAIRSDMEGCNKRLDAWEEEDKKKADAAKAKADAEGEGDEEAAASKKMEESKAERLAADKKKADSKEDEEKKDSAKKADAEEDKEDEKMDAARADAISKLEAQVRDLNRRNDEILRMVRVPVAAEDRGALTAIQSRADAVAVQLGKRADVFMAGETPAMYKRRMAAALQEYSAKWKGIKLDSLPDEAFAIAEDSIYADAVAAARNPSDIQPGRARAVTKVLPTGHTETTFHGNDYHFTQAFGRPARRIRSIAYDRH